jgi:hypothetical protein
MGRLDRLLKISPAASAGVDKPFAHELLHSFAICNQTFALAHLRIPCNTQPAQVLSHSLCEVGARTLRIEVLITKPQDSSRSARSLSGDPERPRMSKVQQSSR